MGDAGGGGLVGGSVAGLSGIWNNRGFRGRSIVDIEARVFVLVGA